MELFALIRNLEIKEKEPRANTPKITEGTPAKTLIIVLKNFLPNLTLHFRKMAALKAIGVAIKVAKNDVTKVTVKAFQIPQEPLAEKSAVKYM